MSATHIIALCAVATVAEAKTEKVTLPEAVLYRRLTVMAFVTMRRSVRVVQARTMTHHAESRPLSGPAGAM